MPTSEPQVDARLARRRLIVAGIRGGMTYDEIASALSVDIRTVYRDIAKIDDAARAARRNLDAARRRAS